MHAGYPWILHLKLPTITAYISDKKRPYTIDFHMQIYIFCRSHLHAWTLAVHSRPQIQIEHCLHKYYEINVFYGTNDYIKCLSYTFHWTTARKWTWHKKSEKCSRKAFGAFEAFEWTDKAPLIFKQDEWFAHVWAEDQVDVLWLSCTEGSFFFKRFFYFIWFRTKLHFKLYDLPRFRVSL